jgi:zinc/manganese transport system permease protein
MGHHVLARGIIFVDLALAQLAALGATVALLAGYTLEGGAAYGFSLLFALLGAGLFALTRTRHERMPQEAIIGITFVVASAASILAVDRAPHGAEHIKGLLVGSILWVTWPTIARTAVVYAGLGVFHWVLRKRFLQLSLDPEQVRREGHSLRLWDFIFYVSFGVMITLSVPIAGVLLVFCFLIVPAVCGVLFSNRTGPQLFIGWGIGLAVSMVGCVLSYRLDLPTGAAVVCTFGLVLLILASARAVLRRGRTGGGYRIPEPDRHTQHHRPHLEK